MTKEEFIEECKNLNIIINPEMIEKLDIYLNLLQEYNKVMNLTNIIEEKDVYLKHYYDSLCLEKVINLNEELTLCDIGTGAGFPGIVLKIVFPSMNITLIEPLQKRCEFLKKVLEILNLKNIEIINDRAEIYAKNNREKFDIVTSRAVSKLNVLSELSLPLVKVNGYFIPYKGNIEEELNSAKYILRELDSEVERIIKYNLPFENSERTLIKIKKIKKTKIKYPRNYSIIKKEQKRM